MEIPDIGCVDDSPVARLSARCLFFVLNSAGWVLETADSFRSALHAVFNRYHRPRRAVGNELSDLPVQNVAGAFQALKWGVFSLQLRVLAASYA